MNSRFSTQDTGALRGRAQRGGTAEVMEKPNRLLVPVWHRAFTLVELLVVIMIITILIALLLPALARARAIANQVVCASDQRQLVIAMTMYLDDNDGIFPMAGYPVYGVQIPSGAQVQNPGVLYWGDLLAPYLGGRTPTPETSPWYYFFDGSPLTSSKAVLACPSLTASQAFSTAFNGIGYDANALAPLNYGGIWQPNGRSINTVRDPSQIMIFADAQFSWPNGQLTGSNGIGAGDLIVPRHLGAANFAYVDGHVAPLKPGQNGVMFGPGISWNDYYDRFPYMEPNWP